MNTTNSAVNVLDLVNPKTFAQPGKADAIFSWLRENQPVCRVESDRYRPFWSVTRYQTIRDIEQNSRQFLSNPRTVLLDKPVERKFEENFGTCNGFESLINHDAPRHFKLRQITQSWFAPKNISTLQNMLEDLSREFVDKMRDLGGVCDFARDIAKPYPLHVIMSILGVPPEDEPRMLRLTQELFGYEDKELSRGGLQENRDGLAEAMAIMLDFHTYFSAMIEDRRANPQDDLATVIAAAEVDGEPISDLEKISYYTITATAGHDTTSYSLAGGLEALMENPHQLAYLKENPDKIEDAIDEIIRWVTPVKHFVRTAKEDCVVDGVTIRAGESIVLHYPSANRDAEIFEDPFKFDVQRFPNNHLAFGYGPHICLGRYLAKLELAIFLRELLPRLEHIELNGAPRTAAGIFVTGLTSLPVRYEMH